MHFEFLVEEPSAEAALQNLLPLILGHTDFAIHPSQGKVVLIRNLPGRLKGYKHWLPQDWRIVVLVDQDDDDCHRLKAALEEAAIGAGLTTKSKRKSGTNFQVLNRVAIEELEAWFFGDPDAVVRAYPRVSASFAHKESYRHPDRIRGGTWEALERLLQRAGYHRGGLSKIRAARDISAHMVPARNSSESFSAFRDGLCI